MDKKILTTLLASSLLGLASPVLAGDVELHHLGTNNTLIRVTGEGNLLMLPVQDDTDDARVNVIVDGKVVDSFRVRLARSRTDFTVPFDLTPYEGKNVILDVVTPQSRSSVRESKDDVCWKDIKVVDSFEWTNTETRYRPLFHHTPRYGWMNDPNGMFYKDGVWHLYYQYNPYGSKWENMTWGHSSSPDLIRWTDEGIAIRPDGLGAIFSGSAVVDTDNSFGAGEDAIIAMYTSAATNQFQSVASSTDGGKSFTPYPANPVLTLESEARDPKVFRNPETGEWNMILAHALDHEMLIFSSPDLKNWKLESSFGKGLGAQDGVWECPDLFPLKVDGEDTEKWVLLCNLNPGGPFGGSGTQYFIGDFDGHVFTPDLDANGEVPTKWMDYGKDHYATVTWSDAPDGRRTAIGWMSNWQYANDVPTLQYRSANTLPRDLSLFRDHTGSLQLASAPSPELDNLRGQVVSKASGIKPGSKGKSFRLPAENDGICEIVALFEVTSGSQLEITLSNQKGEKVVMVYDAAEHTLSFDRKQSGRIGFSDAFPSVTVTPTFGTDNTLSLRIFVDRSSIEVFGDNGRSVMTNLVFPEEPYTTLTLTAPKGTPVVKDLKIYSLRP